MQENQESIALVTGASRGIGNRIAHSLLDENISVIGTARRSTFPDSLADNSRFEGIHVDLARDRQVREYIKSLFNREHFPTILVNNAGISEESAFSSSDGDWLDNWNRTLKINLQTPALICKWALNCWSRDPGTPGIMINISSRAGYRGDTADFAAYAASKGGLAAFTKSVARSYGTNGITAYTIAPGFVNTDMAEEVKESYGPSYLTRDLALNEITPPEQIAHIVTFLARGKGRHMTGSTFHVNAGSYMI